MAYEKHIEELKGKLNAIQSVAAMYKAKADKAQREVFELEASIRKFTHKQEVEAKIVALDIPHRVVALAQLTVDRANEVKRLREGNSNIKGAYFRLRALVNAGRFPKYLGLSGTTRASRGMMIIGWIYTILSEDSSNKSNSLRYKVDAETDKLRAILKEQAA